MLRSGKERTTAIESLVDAGHIKLQSIRPNEMHACVQQLYIGDTVTTIAMARGDDSGTSIYNIGSVCTSVLLWWRATHCGLGYKCHCVRESMSLVCVCVFSVLSVCAWCTCGLCLVCVCVYQTNSMQMDARYVQNTREHTVNTDFSMLCIL